MAKTCGLRFSNRPPDFVHPSFQRWRRAHVQAAFPAFAVQGGLHGWQVRLHREGGRAHQGRVLQRLGSKLARMAREPKRPPARSCATCWARSRLHTASSRSASPRQQTPGSPRPSASRRCCAAPSARRPSATSPPHARTSARPPSIVSYRICWQAGNREGGSRPCDRVRLERIARSDRQTAGGRYCPVPCLFVYSRNKQIRWSTYE